jgi:hypothetical protein
MNEQFATLAQSVQKMKFCNIHWSNTINAGSRRTLSLHNDRMGILIGGASQKKCVVDLVFVAQMICIYQKMNEDLCVSDRSGNRNGMCGRMLQRRARASMRV